MSVPFIPTRNATAGSNAAPTTAALTNTGQMAINAFTGTMYMRKEDDTISDIVGNRLSGFRNRIINGGMVFDQRNAGAAVSLTGVTSNYTVDRWSVRTDSVGVLSVQRTAITLPGFTNGLTVTVTTADTSIGASQVFGIFQRIEGLNCADFAFGTASATPITISFWVRCSLTGTFGGSIQNATNTRAYPFSYTINAANTYVYKTITIPGDTSGTWDKSGSTGISLIFGLGVGSTYNGTAGAWVGGDIRSVTGAVSVVSTAGATFTITGVQLEKGSVATPFEIRETNVEFQMCRRYYSDNTIPSSLYGVYGVPFAGGSVYKFPTYMRAAPTVNISTIEATSIAITSLYTAGTTGDSVSFIFNSSSSLNTLGMVQFAYTATAEL